MGQGFRVGQGFRLWSVVCDIRKRTAGLLVWGRASDVGQGFCPVAGLPPGVVLLSLVVGQTLGPVA